MVSNQFQIKREKNREENQNFLLANYSSLPTSHVDIPMLKRPILAVAAATLAGIASGTTIASATAANRKRQRDIEWAYPSPYDLDDNEENKPSNRFLPTDSFRKTTITWNLKRLLDTWDQEDGEETWPWVWTWHNEHGTHAVFVGVDNHTLQECQRFAEESPQHNLTLVASTDEISSQGLTADDFYAHRCAIIDSSPKQIDMQHQILMLEDERLVCYDSIKFALKRVVAVATIENELI